MDDFNAKKSRAHKMRQDKSRDKPRKNVSSGGVSSKGPSRNINTDRVLGTEDVSEKSSSEPAQTGRDNVEVTIKTFTKRKLASNWDRYEENLNLNKYEKEDDGVGAQYEELISMPVSGGHFKLKHEKEWEKERSELQMQWFQLNLQAIEKNLTTIPFYTRQSLPKHIFSESQIHHMDVRAKQNAASLAEINEGILKIQNLRLSDPETKEKLGTTHKNTPPIKMLQLEEESIEDSKKSSEMEDLDKLLVLQDGESKNTTGTQSGTSVDLLTQENYPESSPEPAKALAQDLTHLPSLQPAVSSSASDLDKPTVSLDDWLDSILDD